MQADTEKRYEEAFENYKIALEYFGTYLKYEKNQRLYATIKEKVLRRAAKI